MFAIAFASSFPIAKKFSNIPGGCWFLLLLLPKLLLFLLLLLFV